MTYIINTNNNVYYDLGDARHLCLEAGLHVDVLLGGADAGRHGLAEHSKYS